MKWWRNIGEYKIRNQLGPYYEIYQYGRTGWIGLNNLGKEDQKLAKEGLEFARRILREKKPHLLILDEIGLALHCKLLKLKEVLELLELIPEETDIVLTGRYAPKELIDRADFVNEVVDIKHPSEIPTTKGIQY